RSPGQVDRHQQRPVRAVGDTDRERGDRAVELERELGVVGQRVEQEVAVHADLQNVAVTADGQLAVRVEREHDRVVRGPVPVLADRRTARSPAVATSSPAAVRTVTVPPRPRSSSTTATGTTIRPDAPAAGAVATASRYRSLATTCTVSPSASSSTPCRAGEEGFVPTA